MNLFTRSSLPLHLNPAGQLEFGPGVVVDEFKARHFGELANVYEDMSTVQDDEVAYLMYNGVYCQNDAARLQGCGLRYELTLFPDRCVGRERIKTLGHIHNIEPRSGIDYPEICEVLLGTAHFFFQKFTPQSDADETFYIEVSVGEKIIIPPGYHHLTINPGPGPLLFSDVVAVGISGNYADFINAGGAAYLEVEIPGEPGIGFIPNPRYANVPPLTRRTPRQFPGLRIAPSISLYRAFVATRGELWGFLKQPGAFAHLFSESVFLSAPHNLLPYCGV